MTCRCFCWSESLCEHGLVWNVDPWLHCRCVVVVACLPPQRPGAVGTAESTLTRSVMPSALPWLPLLCLPWSWPKVSEQVLLDALFLYKLGFPWGPYNHIACMHCMFYVGCHLLAFCSIQCKRNLSLQKGWIKLLVFPFRRLRIVINVEYFKNYHTCIWFYSVSLTFNKCQMFQVTALRRFLKSQLSLMIKLKDTRRLRKLCFSWRSLRHGMTSRRWATLKLWYWLKCCSLPQLNLFDAYFWSPGLRFSAYACR